MASERDKVKKNQTINFDPNSVECKTGSNSYERLRPNIELDGTTKCYETLSQDT